jgi:hypothetical protein
MNPKMNNISNMAKISATFVDFSKTTNQYDVLIEEGPKFWREELQDISRAGIQDVIIARSVVRGRAHYKSSMIPEWTSEDLVEVIFEEAKKIGLGVYLGLDLNTNFWDRSRDFSRLMKKDLLWNSFILNELAGIYSGDKALKGIYISNELDRDNLDTPERLAACQEFMGSMYELVKTKFSLPVMSSPFFSKSIPFKELAGWWENALDRPMFDILAMQDGVGCRYRHIDPEDVSEFYPLLAPILKSKGIEFWNNAETFELPDWSSPLVPAKMERIQDQYQAAAPHVSRTITWEYGHFLGRQLVSGQRYEEFCRWNLSGTGQETQKTPAL